MKKYLHLTGLMDDQMLEELLCFCNNLQEEDKATIFFTSHGGNATLPDTMSEIINNNNNIEKVIFTWEATSAGFYLMLKISPSKRVIQSSVHSGIHLSSRDVNTNELLSKLDTENEMLLSDLDDANKDKIFLFENIGLTKKEINKIKKGKLIYLKYDRVIEAVRLYDENKNEFKSKMTRV